MSPNGLNAPPALAATTMFAAAMATNRGCPLPTAITTAHITSAVVRLSAIGDRKKAMMPVIQNTFRRPNPRETSQARSHSKTFRSVIALMYVIATRRKKNSSANSRNVCRKASCSACCSAPVSRAAIASRTQIAAPPISTGLDFRMWVNSSVMTTR